MAGHCYDYALNDGMPGYADDQRSDRYGYRWCVQT